jgi:hypothetical protein
VVFVAGVTRTATCTACGGIDVTTGELLQARVLVERVGWLAALIAETGQQVIDAHWTAGDIRAICAKESAPGVRMPSFAYKAVAALWGWSKLPADVYGVSRVAWMRRSPPPPVSRGWFRWPRSTGSSPSWSPVTATTPPP